MNPLKYKNEIKLTPRPDNLPLGLQYVNGKSDKWDKTYR